MDMNKRITRFIRNFAGSEKTFTSGCCYWFAYILNQEFGLEIVYEPIEGHFLARDSSNKKYVSLYDVRGDVTQLYKDCDLYGLSWLMENERGWYDHLMMDCRHFLPRVDDTEVA